MTASLGFSHRRFHRAGFGVKQTEDDHVAKLATSPSSSSHPNSEMVVFDRDKANELLQHPRAGVFLAVLSEWAFTLMDTLAQHIEQMGLPPGELAFIRMSITLTLSGMLLYMINPELLKNTLDKSQRLTWSRALIMTLIILFFYAALEYLAISEVVTIGQLRPFPTALVCWLVLKEAFTWVQATASIVSFGAVILVVRPSFSETGQVRAIGFLLMIIIILLSSLDILLCRMLGAEADPTFMIFTYSITTVFISPLWMVIQQTSPVAMTVPMILPLVGVILLGWIAQVTMILALKREKGTTVAIIGYSSIVFSVIVQAIFTATFPSPIAVVGMVIIGVAGVWSALKGSPPEKGNDKTPVSLATVGRTYDRISQSEEV